MGWPLPNVNDRGRQVFPGWRIQALTCLTHWCDLGAPTAWYPHLWNGQHGRVPSWDGRYVLWVHIYKMLQAVLGTCIRSMLVLLFSVTLSFKMRQCGRGWRGMDTKMWLRRWLVLTLLERSWVTRGVISGPCFSFCTKQGRGLVG